jgi:hypothetical protein
MAMRTDPIAHVDITERARALATTLGYTGDPGYFTPELWEKIPNYRHAMQQALTTMSVVGCFGFLSAAYADRMRYTPVVYIAAVTTAEAADDVHRMVWSQGIVPLLLIATPVGVQLREAFHFHRGTAYETLAWDAVLADDGPPSSIAHLLARRLRGSLAWKDFAPAPTERVDSRLLGSVQGLSYSIQNRSSRLANRPDLINALIGRVIYLFVLVDRKVIDQIWVDDIRILGQPACSSIQLDAGQDQARWNIGEFWTLLSTIDSALNGTVFPINERERSLIDESVLHDVRRVVRNGDVLVEGEGRQLSFLDVSFVTLRTETISAMYELFLRLQDPEMQSEDGAFYTPPYVADYMLDELEGLAPFNGSARVLDPAAGSGVFLVGAFRRIAEACTPPGGWTLAQLPGLKNLLSQCIFGVERSPQAVNIARLSLYLTLLDYAQGASLTDIRNALGGEQLFPKMLNNISSSDFFLLGSIGGQPGNSFTHVIGNPPWGKLRDKEHAASKYLAQLQISKHPVDYSRVEEIFLWKVVRDVVAPGAAIALLVSTKCFVNAGATRFPTAVARQVSVVGLANLSHFRYRLFPEARNPATVLFALAREARELDPAWVYSPLLISQPISTKGHPWAIVADRRSFTYIRHKELRTSSRAWSRSLMLQPFDRRNAHLVVEKAEAEHATLGAFLTQAKMMVSRGGTPSQTKLPARMILGGDKGKSNYYRHVLGLDHPGELLLHDSPRSTYNLDATTVASLPDPYRRLFAGNVLVVTRHMVEFDIVDQPAALNSTVNIIGFQDESPQRTTVQKRRAVLALIKQYLSSELAEYLYALVGRSWLLDGRRFEKRDLLLLPFPFRNMSDAKRAMDEAAGTDGGIDFTRRLQSSLRLDGLFAEAVQQYSRYRRGYQDAQVPNDALSTPDESIRNRYRSALEAELSAALGPEAKLRLSYKEASSGDFERIFVSIGLQGEEPPTTASDSDAASFDTLPHVEWTGFNDDCSVYYDRDTSTVEMLKPRTLAAWTMDRAYADRLRIVEQIARS